MPQFVTKKATVSTAHGNALDTPIPFEYGFEELQKGDEIPAAEYPDASDILAWVNTKRNAAARSVRQNQVLTDAGITKPTLEDPNVAFATMVKSLMAQGKSREKAEKAARIALDME
jgi:hypothetical protein